MPDSTITTRTPLLPSIDHPDAPPGQTHGTAVIHCAVAVATALDCLHRAAGGDPATRPDPAGHRAVADIISYWQTRVEDASLALQTTLRTALDTASQVQTFAATAA